MTDVKEMAELVIVVAQLQIKMAELERQVQELKAEKVYSQCQFDADAPF